MNILRSTKTLDQSIDQSINPKQGNLVKNHWKGIKVLLSIDWACDRVRNAVAVCKGGPALMVAKKGPTPKKKDSN